MDQPKQRQSSTHSEELFEFVDYTSVSNFERLVTAIEEILLSWEVKDGSFGIFSDDQVSSASAAITNPSSTEFSRHELLSVGDEAYKLTFHCHPMVAHRLESDQTLALSDFFLFDTTTFHPLHRWTGFGRFFILAPVLDPLKTKLFSRNRVVDPNQAKYLLSACAIAFHNTGCTVPAFVQMNHSRHGLYSGYMLHCGPDDPLSNIEIRFNTIVTAASSEYTNLNGLQRLFLKKLGAQHDDNDFPSSVKDNDDIWATAVFTYNLKNWFDENWKSWDEGHNQPVEDPKAKRRSSFSDDFEEWDNQPLPQSSTTTTTTTTTESNLPSLPFGSYNDPLRSVTLNAIFPINPIWTYTENPLHINMDALTANAWQISREFAPSSQQRAFLSAVVDQTVNSWIKDPSNQHYLAPYDTNNKSEEIFATGQDSGLVRNFLHAMSQNRTNIPNNQVTVIKSDHVENILASLFNADIDHHNISERPQEDHIRHCNETKGVNLHTTRALGMRLKHGTPVPYRSFLWDFLHLSLHVSSDPAISSYVGFLRILWIEVVRRIRWHWENLVPIPKVNPRLYSPVKVQDSCETVTLEHNDAETLGVDLRFNILHQKLAMINCCIHRGLQAQRKDSGSIQQNTRKSTAALFDSVVEISQIRPECTENRTQKPKSRFDKFNSMLEKLVEGDSYIGLDESDEDLNTVITEKGDQLDDMSESDIFFDSVEDVAAFPEQKSDASSQHKQDTTQPSQASSRTSSISDALEIVPNSMGESFVRLNYSSSADSDRCNLPLGNILGRTKESEIQDPDAFDGRSHQHEHLCLLNTAEPMWVPVTQELGFVTEDMIKQQSAIFERMGSSEDATQLRAKLQSAQLYSDMQAFKAANPHATLEDFVRWYSPKDWVEGINLGNQDGSPSVTGKLSARMSEPTNLWQELWKCSQRVPASRQKPLFNITAEGEKALHYLETISVHEVFAALLPTLGLLSYDTLLCHPVIKYSRPVAQGLSNLSKELVEFPWDELRDGRYTIDHIVLAIRQQESMMCNAISLLRKLPQQYKLVDRLLEMPRTFVEEGEERAAVFNMFKNDGT
ncbi:Rab3 GTPase-activating protein catalytic subunit [Apophysomyces sp. BC1034]|nr:Rab3 GTPase-activating protein catalytic subunit [Apophysomyces sp. BC1021]KAG0186015.1 Rab3 GTPase-activating protein catalytic subunit [Apophysomyces sp. BC1034]